ncbi:MAG: PIG-L deacetylase family protein [Candidatus Latescibacteria bacterium]|jgi:LmbE family N-acetylglucosaminyl deacetylase|nr:PIG-L deacetylase family protein [Candidatus Latescibacterota bacterium]
MNVLAVGAHFDDVELGCGGTLALHARRGEQVTIYVATHSGYSAPDGREIRSRELARGEGERGAEILGAELLCGDWETNQLNYSDPLVCSVLEIVEERGIDIIYTHWAEDAHQDHRALARASITAGKHVPRILMYQSNFYDGGEAFAGNFYVDIGVTLEQKKAAINAHESELGRVGGDWLEVFLAKARVDGYRAGAAYAEAFEVVKYLGTP